MITVEDFHFDRHYLKALDVEIHEQGYLKADEEWHYNDLTSPYHRLYIITKGRCQVSGEADGKPTVWILEEGSAWLIPAGQKYSYRTNGLLEKYYFHFNALLYGVSDIFSHLVLPLEIKNPELPVYSGAAGEKASFLSVQLEIRNMLYILLARVLCLEDVNLDTYTAGRKSLTGVYEFIRNNRSVILTSGLLEETFHRSVSSLNEHFKEHSGMTVKQYNEKYICSLAEKSLLFTSLPSCEIADNLGFRDYYYFSRFFKKHTGFSPRAYRKMGGMYTKF